MYLKLFTEFNEPIKYNDDGKEVKISFGVKIRRMSEVFHLLCCSFASPIKNEKRIELAKHRQKSGDNHVNFVILTTLRSIQVYQATI